MIYRCTGCSQNFDFPALKKGVHAVCPQCGADLEEGPSQAGQAFLVRVGPDGKELARFPAVAGAVIGRETGCAILIDDDSISNAHASLVGGEGRPLSIVDCDSTNGTRVNGVRVTMKTLRDGDEVRVGRVGLVFRETGGPAVGGALDLTFLASDKGAATVQREYRPGATLLMAPGTVPVGPTGDSLTLMRMQRVLEMTADLATRVQSGPLLDTLAQDLFDTFGVDRVVVLTKEGERNAFSVVLAKRADGGPLESLSLSRTLLSKVVQDRTAVVTSDLLTDSRVQVTGSLLAVGSRSALIAPLLVKDEVLGLVWADTLGESKSFGDADLKMFCGLVSAAAAALANARLYKRVAQETRVRAHLSRYLAPTVVQHVLDRRISLDLGGELREATVLFSDVRGFTAASESMEPKDIVRMLNRYFGKMVDIVFRNGGTVDKFIGDAIMAVWGVPESMPSHALAAVRAAIQMQRAVLEFNRESRAQNVPDIAMGVGIHSGPVLAGNIGCPLRMEFTVIGDTVNTASRIESSTSAGDIFVSRDTFDRLEGRIPARPLPPIRVKNKTKPLELLAVDLQKLATVSGV